LGNRIDLRIPSTQAAIIAHDARQFHQKESEHMDPNPDYDASDEIEYGTNWFAWILRGVYPPPAYPPV
jgi:hypothetical protein